MTKFTVTMNGENFVTFDTDKFGKEAERMAYAYVDMQRRSIRGAGLGKTPADVPDVKRSFAAKQSWDVRKSE